MLLDLLSSNNFVSYNVLVAQVFGLHSAIYINELMIITEKAIRKNRLTDGFVQLDREYIKSRTTIPSEDQLEIDKKLISMGLLDKNEVGQINLHIEELFSIIVNNDAALNKDITDIMSKIKQARKPSKTEAISDKLKSYIVTTNPELREAYIQWIDAVVLKEGWMSAASVSIGQQIVDRYANHDLDIALSIVRIASINGWRDMQWAINDLGKNRLVTQLNFPNQSSTIPQYKTVSEVF